MKITEQQLQAIKTLWDATDIYAEDTESEFADTPEQFFLITARNQMGLAFDASHPIYAPSPVSGA